MTEQNSGSSEDRQEEPRTPEDEGSSWANTGEHETPGNGAQGQPSGSTPEGDPRQGSPDPSGAVPGETSTAGQDPPRYPHGSPQPEHGGAQSPYPQPGEAFQQPYGPGQSPRQPGGFPGGQQSGSTQQFPPPYGQAQEPQYGGQQYPGQQGMPYSDPYQQGQYAAYHHAPLPPTGAEKGRGNGGRGRFVAGVTALAAVVGLVGGGIGSYAVNQWSDDTSSVTSFDQPRPASNTGTAEPGSVQAVADKVLPSVVQIQARGFGGASSGTGSGIIISEDGYILTNNHVVSGAEGSGSLVARFNDGKTARLEVVGTAPWSDLAVVKADAQGLTPATLGNSEDVPVGSGVVAIGSPYGLSGTVTSGIISATDRPVRAGGESGSQSTVLNALQTDAAINPGNSGGPLVNMDGQVIGINSAIYSPGSGSPGGQAGSVGLGFAIPIDHAQRIGKQLIEDGSAERTTLGVTVDITGRTSGALVVEVPSGGPAAKAGIERGDVITKVDDRLINSGDELVAAVRSHAPGETVTLTVTDRQGGNERTVQATLAGTEM
ncbi:trypsin-like peptidase domain-containing protein [Actinopolyspora mortivallis]|uniref:trypsin-like peptidase domain-containing protein n=1 Tax=Actinopolyspora mortivallis TaxID=33906 RepID=UPI00039B14EB|nr:trypsin-like peptidase domain-containing protein [Actinopolyspora mortivallis]